MRKLIVSILLTSIICMLMTSGCKQNEFIKYHEEYKDEYYKLCSEVITDTKVISRENAYETAKLLQTSASKSRLERLQELLSKMKEYEGKNDSYIGYSESLSNDYDLLILIKESYEKWDVLSDDEKIYIARMYGIIVTFYSIEVDERNNQSK